MPRTACTSRYCAVEQPADGGQQPFPLLIDAVGLRQAFDFDDRHGSGIIGGW